MKTIKKIILLVMTILFAIEEVTGAHFPQVIVLPLITLAVIIILMLEDWYCELTGKCVPILKKLWRKKQTKPTDKSTELKNQPEEIKNDSVR